MRFIGIIPARMGSTRLPGKPLIDICGKPMIQHVYERAKKCLGIVYVATDSMEIFDTVIAFGGKAVMTPNDCNSGTDRCLFAYEKIKKMELGKFDIIINIQGDEPLLPPDHIKTLVDLYRHKRAYKVEKSDCIIAAIACKEDTKQVNQNYHDNAFVTLDKNQNALYFSRYMIPYDKKGVGRIVYHQIGIYAYSYFVLKRFCELEKSSLERAESLEQNRWLEEGYRIKVGITLVPSVGVDTEMDLKRVRKIMTIIKE